MFLKETIAIIQEPQMPSTRATQSRLYAQLGLVDAAIGEVAREHKCAVLTDDLDLYLSLTRERIAVLNFTHLQASEWGV